MARLAILQVRLDLDVMRALQDRAQGAGLSVAAYVRESLEATLNA